MRKVVLLLFLAVTSLCMAQKKELSQAKANIKAGNNLAQAEQSMRKLLEDSDNIRETKIWLTMFEAIKNNMIRVMKSCILNKNTTRRHSLILLDDCL